MRYLLALGIVTAQPTLHVRDSTLAGEAVQVEIELRMRYRRSLLTLFIGSYRSGNYKCRLVQASAVLNQLYEGDDGQSSPNLKNEYQLKVH
jgi:hypothetical protein